MTAAWLASLWAASLRGGIALLAAWALCHVSRMPPAVRCWVWRAAYGVLLVSLAWTTPVDLPLLPAIVAEPSRAHSEIGPPNRFELDLLGRAPSSAAGGHSGFDAASKPVAASVTPAPPIWPKAAFLAWLVLLAAYAARLAIGWLNALRLRNGRPVDAPELADLCRTMSIRLQPAVRAHPGVRGPLLVGLWRPMIVLPEAITGSTHRRLVLAHELAHLRRWDLMWNWLPTLAMAALPFHPLVWICNRRWRLATEAACDAAAMAATAADPAEYGRILVHVATTPPPPVSGVLAVAVAAESRWLLIQRLTAMSNITHWNRRRLVSAGLTLTVFTIIATVPWRVVAQPAPGGRDVPKAPAPSTMPATAPAAAVPDRFNAAAMGQIRIPAAHIRSLTSGTVERVNYAEGQAVKKGDVLVGLESKARADAVASASAIVKASQERYTLVQSQFKAGMSTPADASGATLDVEKAKDTLQQRQAELDQARIIAPFDGTLSDVKCSVGSTVLPGDEIATVFTTGRPSVEFRDTPDRARGLKPGMPIEISSRDSSIDLGRGEITTIGPDIDPGTGTMRIQAKLVTTTRALAPGEFVQVRFHTGE